MLERTDICNADFASKIGDALKHRSSDTSEQCMWCGSKMMPEHAHYRCTSCGSRDSCCDGPY